MSFFDDDDDLVFDDDFEDEPFGFDEDEEDIDFDIEEGAAAGGGRSNRTFLIGVIVMAGLFLVGICVVVLLLLARPIGPDANAQTNTQVMILLATTQAHDTQVAFTTETAVAAAILQQTADAERSATAQALGMTQTAEAMVTPTETPTLTQEPTEEPTAGPTTSTVIVETATPHPTPTEEATSEVADLPTPTLEGELPDTGIADDLGLGGSIWLVGIAAFGLLAVMVVARRLRSNE